MSSSTASTNTAAMTSTSQKTTKTFRNKKKIDEVKEIIQNKPDIEISRVLDYFDNDVGKAIDAFVTDGGKEALAKWNETKNEKKKAKKNNENGQIVPESSEEAADDANKTQKNGAAKGNKANGNNQGKKGGKSNKQPQQQNGNNSNGSNTNGRGSANRNNINDLVTSIINQYTGPNAATNGSSVVQDEAPIKPNPIQSSQQLVDDLNRLVLSNGSSTATISGLKVTVVGIQANQHHTANNSANVNSTAQTISSVSSSPSSMSSSSSFDTRQLLQSHATHTTTSSSVTTGGRPSLLELKANTGMAPLPQRNFNKQINNPKAREILEKPQKDLQRQSAVLSKIATVFQEEANKGQLLLVQTFSQLHKLLDQRQAQLQAQLLAAVQSGNDMLRQRQSKAVNLKLSVDNSVHLTDDETLELKADIKHFVSERQLDEEFGKLKLFDDNCKELIESIQRAGAVPVVTNKYAKQRPPLNELLNGSLMTPATPVAPSLPVNGNHKNAPSSAKQQQQQQPTVQKGHHEQLDTNNNRSNGHAHKNNNGGAGFDGEGEFIEVKKSRKNKPKPAPSQPEQLGVPVEQAAPVKTAAAANGYNNHQKNGANGKSSNGGYQLTNGQGRFSAKPPRGNGQEVRAH